MLSLADASLHLHFWAESPPAQKIRSSQPFLGKAPGGRGGISEEVIQLHRRAPPVVQETTREGRRVVGHFPSPD
jgi:hypothetical protein